MEKENILETGRVTEAADLLYALINHSFETSGTVLRSEINGDKKTIQDLYWSCKEQMKKIAEIGSKANFLQMSVLENTWNEAMPLLLVPLREMMDGDMLQFENAKKLQKIFDADESKKEWREKVVLYKIMLEKMGFQAEENSFGELSDVINPLLDALSFYDDRRTRNIYQVRKGEKGNGNPSIMTEVCKFHTEKELTDAVMHSGRECAIAFGAIEKMEFVNYLRKWITGNYGERIHNLMEHGLSLDEIVSDHIRERSIWMAVKNGENCWLIKMPIKSHYGEVKKYYYGERSSYAPFNVFFPDFSAAPADTTFLQVTRKGYRLNEMMDMEQQVWLPVFLNETIRLFYGETELQTKEMYFPEECCAKVGKTEIVVVGSQLPSIKTISYDVPAPEVMDPEHKELYEMFHVTMGDLENVPLVNEDELLGKEDFYQHMESAVKSAYCHILSERVADYVWENIWDTRVLLVNLIQKYQDDLIDRAVNGEFDSFTYGCIDGDIVLDKDGNPRMKQSWLDEKNQRYVIHLYLI